MRFRESDALRFVFEEIVSRCIKQGLVGDEGFAVDASTIQADVNWERSVPGADMQQHLDCDQETRLVKDYLDALDREAIQGLTPNKISLIDPWSRWASNRKGAAD